MTARRYALLGEVSHTLLSWRGRTIVHNHRGELEFLIANAKVVECPKSIPPEDTIDLPHLPQFAAHRFPLRREDYR
jgi:hypothetical protein